MRSLLLGAFFVVTASVQNAVAVDNVQQLLDYCKSSRSSHTATFCLAYISGVVDLMQVVGNGGPPSSVLIGACGDITKYTGGSLVQVFINWAEKYPKSWTLPAIVGVTASIKEQLPCKGN